MINPNAIRAENSQELYPYSHAFYDRSMLAQTGILIDERIAMIQRRLQDKIGVPMPDLQAEIETLSNFAHSSITTSDQLGDKAWTDYYRLVSQMTFIEQRIKAPFVFEESSRWKQREQLVNGTYALSAQIIDAALEEYDNTYGDTVSQRTLRGAIQEQTFIALFNRKQHRNRLAVPSATYDDLLRKTDVDVWSIPDKHQEPYYLPVQVKSLRQHAYDNSSPENGITIYARDFNNRGNMMTSRLIATEYRYMIGEGEQLGDCQTLELEYAHEKLLTTIESKSRHIF